MLGDREITFIGSGIMGEAMIGGLLAKDVLTAHHIMSGRLTVI